MLSTVSGPRRARRRKMYTKVLLAYDGSEAGQKALLDCREIV